MTSPTEPTPNASLTKCDQCNGDGCVYPNGIGDGHNHQDVCPSCGGAGGFDPMVDLQYAKGLAAPSPAAQDDPAKGLEVVAWLYNTVGGEKKALVRPLQYFDGDQVLGEPLTDHATATRQLAERDARIAELMTALSVIEAARSRASARALAAEAQIATDRRIHEARVNDLLEANNRYLQEGRDARADAARVREALGNALNALDSIYGVAEGMNPNYEFNAPGRLARCAEHARQALAQPQRGA